jgi:hypothetical protein
MRRRPSLTPKTAVDAPPPVPRIVTGGKIESSRVNNKSGIDKKDHSIIKDEIPVAMDENELLLAKELPPILNDEPSVLEDL